MRQIYREKYRQTFFSLVKHSLFWEVNVKGDWIGNKKNKIGAIKLARRYIENNY